MKSSSKEPAHSLDSLIKNGERVPFNQKKREENQKKPRKEVNLSDLKKALEESLSTKELEPPKAEDKSGESK